MTRLLTGLAALVAAFFFTTAPAYALMCGPRTTIETWLDKTYGEERVFVAINRAGDQVAIYLNPEKGTWSAVLRPRKTPDLLCPLDSGQQGQMIWAVGPQAALR